MSISDPLAPRRMPLGDVVCGWCDSGSPHCPYHRNESPSAGLMQMIPSMWGDRHVDQ